MVNDGWWWLMMVDDGWWWLMMVDDGWYNSDLCGQNNAINNPPVITINKWYKPFPNEWFIIVLTALVGNFKQSHKAPLMLSIIDSIWSNYACWIMPVPIPNLQEVKAFTVWNANETFTGETSWEWFKREKHATHRKNNCEPWQTNDKAWENKIVFFPWFVATSSQYRGSYITRKLWLTSN